MIQIRASLFLKLKNRKIFEECGFVAGKDEVYDKMYIVKNISEKENEFEMSFFSKLWNLIKIFLSGRNSIIVYHVHNNIPTLSKSDIKNAMIGMSYMIIMKKEIYLYVLFPHGKHVVTLPYEVI